MRAWKRAKRTVQATRRHPVRAGAVLGSGLAAACALGTLVERDVSGNAFQAQRELPDVGASYSPGFLEGPAGPRVEPWNFQPLPQTPAQAMTQGQWRALGPAPTLGGQSITQNGNQTGGAVQDVAPHPTNPDILYIGAVNGGVWVTNNATALNPTWRPLTDNMPSLSTGALELDPADPNVLVFGNGLFGSFGRAGGGLLGLLRSADAGNTWTALDSPLLRGQNISGVASRGAVILASSNSANGGVFRSSDTGATFVQVSGAANSGLPAGPATDMVGDPSNRSRLYVALPAIGLFQSDDLGVTWTNITANDQTGIGAEIRAATGNTRNIEMSVANNGRLYVAVLPAGRPTAIGFRDSGSATFVRMDLPTFPSGGATAGSHPGNQGAIHLGIAAFPTDPQSVVLSGDRSVGAFVQSSGADGNVNRGDSRQRRMAAGANISPQWEHMSHSSVQGLPQGGALNRTAPHADHRDDAFDARGDLLNGNDGGIYRRTNPLSNQGDWTSIIGNLQITEFHDIAYDSLGNVVIGGAQDNGTPGQQQPGNATWRSLGGGDGGTVEVDDTSTPGLSRRLVSSQNFGGARFVMFNAQNQNMGAMTLGRNLLAGAPLQPQFVTPVGLNQVDPTRLVIGGANGVYESLDRGANIRQVTGAPSTNRDSTLIYGNRQDRNLIVAAAVNQIFTRRGNAQTLTPTAAPFPGQRVQDIVVDPGNAQVIYAIDATDLYRTTNGGAAWEKITGNLITAFSPGALRSINYVESTTGGDRILVGTNTGVFIAREQTATQFARLGTGLPNAPVFDLDYDPADDVLVAGMLGRGAFRIDNVSQLTVPAN
jgi:hypothetical protein